MCFLCIMDDGGRLRGITNTGQQLYWVAVIPKGLNPSRPMATRQFLGSLAFSLCLASNAFHASPSEGCINIGSPFSSNSFLIPCLCHVICFAVMDPCSKVYYSRHIREALMVGDKLSKTT